VQKQPTNQRIGVVNALRAFAAIFVAWGHFVTGHGEYLGLSGKYGHLGVDIFFVISGFVIPWSLYRARYTLRDYPRFLLKRNVRLYPPYVASIAVTIVATNFIMEPVLHFPRLTVTTPGLLAHLVYLNDIVHVPWVNVVYWTLAIEFQWYLLVGLMFPLLLIRSKFTGYFVLAGIMVPCILVGNDRLIFRNLPIFLIGIFVFQDRIGLISRREMLALIAVTGLAMMGPIGWIVACVSLATGTLIAFATFENRTMDRVGDVSYSLYLLHLPIGVTLIGCLARWLPYSGSYMVVLDVIGLAASGLAAWIMYQFVEKPSQEMSSAIRFTGRSQEPAAPERVAAAAGD
jgi:peptidoglycan/LPS O-acetylase OafA/YrhL